MDSLPFFTQASMRTDIDIDTKQVRLPLNCLSGFSRCVARFGDVILAAWRRRPNRIRANHWAHRARPRQTRRAGLHGMAGRCHALLWTHHNGLGEPGMGAYLL